MTTPLPCLQALSRRLPPAGLLAAAVAAVLFAAGPAAAFDTGHHYDLTRDALSKEGFGPTAIQVVQVENWLTDWYSESPTSSFKDDLAKMHFDSLDTPAKVRNSWAWLTVNTRTAAQKAARANDPVQLLTIMGVSIHAVQDFYSHSDWTSVVQASGTMKTWFDAPELWNDARLRTGVYPGDNLPEEQRHGDYWNHGINKDSYIRPGWARAYMTAYVASRQWVSAMRQWVNEVNPAAWAAAQSYSVTGDDSAALGADLDAAYRISEWISLKGGNGHWKGPGSGSLTDFAAITAAWVAKGDSPFVRAFKTKCWGDLVSGLPGDSAPTVTVPAVPHSNVDDRAVIIRTLHVEEGKGPAIDPLGKADFYARIGLGGQTFTEATQMNQTSINPAWTTIKFVPASQTTVPILYQLWDEDAPLAADDHIDINPASGRTDLQFTFDVRSHSCSGDVHGVCDSDLSVVTSAGNEGKRGSVRFFVTEESLSVTHLLPAATLPTDHYYRLTTQWQGAALSLDIVNDGQNNRPVLDKTADVSGQCWKLTPAGEGYYRLTTQWRGDDYSLDILNDGQNIRLILAKTADVAGQYWRLTSLLGGYYRLTTQWRGDDYSLDILNDGQNKLPFLAHTADVSGQFWKLTPLQPVK